MPKDVWQYLKIKGFEGGENTDWVDDSLKENQHLLLQNVDLDSQYGVKKRPGTTRVTSSPLVTGKSVLSMHRYYQKDGDKYLLVQCGTKVFNVNTATGAATQIATGLPEVALKWYTYNDTAYAMNGGGSGFYSWDGTTWSTISGGNIVAIKKGLIYEDKLFAAGNTTNPSNLYFSNAYDPETWDATDILRVRDNDGDKIQDMAHVATGHLLVLKDTSAWLVLGSDVESFSKKLSTDDVGLTGNTLQSVQGRPIWLSNLGICWYNPYSSIQPFRIVSRDKVNDEILEYSRTVRDAAVGHYHPTTNKYLLSVPTATTPTVHVVHLDIVSFTQDGKPYKTFPFTRYVGLAITAFVSFDGTGDDGSLWFGTDDGHVHYFDEDVYEDNGSAISIAVQTGYLDCGLPDHRKRIHSLTVPLGVQGSTDLDVVATIIRDWGAQTQVTTTASITGVNMFWDVGFWDQNYWGADNFTANARFRFYKTVANKFTVKVTKSSDAQFIMRPFTVRYLPVDHRSWIND